MTTIQLYQILRQRLGEKEAESLVSFVDLKIKENNEANLKILATKEDLARVEGRLEAMIAGTKAELIKWMFIFWISQLASFIAIVKFLIVK